MIRIRSKKPGFRRGGMAHATEWTEYPDDRFTRKQLERLQAEPMLQVEVVSDPIAAPEPVPAHEADAADETPAAERKTARAAKASRS